MCGEEIASKGSLLGIEGRNEAQPMTKDRPHIPALGSSINSLIFCPTNVAIILVTFKLVRLT